MSSVAMIVVDLDQQWTIMIIVTQILHRHLEPLPSWIPSFDILRRVDSLEAPVFHSPRNVEHRLEASEPP